MNHLLMLILALLLDAVLGEPRWLWSRIPHPAALMGRAVATLEAALNHGNRRRNGILTVLVLVVASGLTGWLLAKLPDHGLIEILLAAILLAQNSLVSHVSAVASALQQGGLPAGRKAVALIVGRDPEALDENGVIRSAIESLAENFSDGVVAPAFWFLLFGLPGIMVYKMANTLDSMIAYRNPRYLEFGWAAARLDDLMNWIPARLSGALICLAHGSADAFLLMRRDAPLHRSPNAGWPEAALAATIGVAVSGPRVYDGQKTDDPFVNAEGRQNLLVSDIGRAVRAIWLSWWTMLALLILGETVWSIVA